MILFNSGLFNEFNIIGVLIWNCFGKIILLVNGTPSTRRINVQQMIEGF